MRVVPVLLSCLLAALPAGAQVTQSSDRFGGSCAAASAGAEELCLRVAEAARILGARSAIVLGGGNPVPGTASTMGMRMGSHPRLSIAVRGSAAATDLPGLDLTSTEELDFTATAIAVDVGVGLFNGVTLAPTVGGFGSIDLIAGLSHLRLPTGDGLSGSVTSWSAGARLGLLRESFTAPGVSVSAQYRRLGDFWYGDPELARHDAWFRLQDMAGWSLRAAAGKRLLGLGLTAGAGYDSYSAEAAGRVRDAAAPSGRFLLQDDDLGIARTTLFANGAFNLLILHAVAELGWQSGGDEEAGIPTTGLLEKAGLYGSLAIRLSL